MKIGFSLSLILLSSLAQLCWSQATTPAPAPAAPTAPAASKPHGPEAVAAQDPNRIVATIDGQKLTAKQAADLLKPFQPEQRKQIDANLTKAVEQIYTQRQLADAAKKLKLEDQSPWKEQLELTKEGVLARAYITHMQEAAGKDPAEDPQKYYDAHAAEFDTVKLSGIFVAFNPPGTPASSAAPNARTEEQAKEKANDIEKKLKAGGDFAALARSESDNPSASKGGELGTLAINDPSVNIPAEVKNAVAKLKPGEISEPIRMNGTLLIVKLDSQEKVPFDKAKDTIAKKLKAEHEQSVVKKELEKYTMKVEDPDFFDTGVSPSPRTPSLQRPSASVTAPKP
jgi:parvulin-like peptidyl-prolyl isomerase